MALFQPIDLGGGAIKLKHRVVLAPLTRQRADEPQMAPGTKAVEYYGQRASPGGLLISEATNISTESCGYHHAPGIWTEEQIAGWCKVTEAVHNKSGFIFCQLWHIGRVSHPSWVEHPLLKSRGGPMPSVSASEQAVPGKTLNSFPQGPAVPNAAPRALRTDEIPRLVSDYCHAARCAMRAGFDGVEIHSAHGYLLDQFLRDGTNNRTDQYGGSPENRCRLLLEVVEAVSKIVGPGRVAVRLSPTQPGSASFFGAKDTNELDAEGRHKTYALAVRSLNAYPLAYLLFTEPRWAGGKYDNDVEKDPGFNMPITNSNMYRPLYKGILMAAGGFLPASADEAVRQNSVDLVAFGRWFISNPDLPERIRLGKSLNRYVRDTFYSYEVEGYTDYPDLQGTVGVAGKYPLVDLEKLKGSAPAQAKL
eukprot:TRINITY_DN48760_c0_g1_i1.p1 TRINITY_DN48760_c0_g1~~TRINITY_DN48760_c0_g1_i1.p1  ORF type:complete len:420 (-),score=69.60 TRINITY_DN48760_c0_g1_i1:15-1274(-)